MDSSRDASRPLYDSIPAHPAGQLPLRDGVRDRLSRVARSSSISRLFKAVVVGTLIVASVFVLTSPCISCDLLTFKQRIFRLVPRRLSFAQRYAHGHLSYIRFQHASPLSSYGRYSSKALRRFSPASIAYSSRQDLLSEPEVGFSIEEFVPTHKCSVRRYCRARMIVTKDEYGVSVQAGFNISSVNGRPISVDRGTRGRVGATAPEEFFHWALQLVHSVSEELAELDCPISLEDVAHALYITSESAYKCPRTDSALCHELITVADCPSVHPPPTLPPMDSCEKAFDECEFTFYGESSLATFSVEGPPDKPFTPVIVAKDPEVHLGTLNSNNVVPEFIEDSGALPITDFGSQRFAQTQFKPVYIWQQQGSGIGHQTFHGDQQELSKGRCIRIYFTDIQLKDPASNLNHVPKSENKCVVFRTE